MGRVARAMHVSRPLAATRSSSASASATTSQAASDDAPAAESLMIRRAPLATAASTTRSSAPPASARAPSAARPCPRRQGACHDPLIPEVALEPFHGRSSRMGERERGRATRAHGNVNGSSVRAELPCQCDRMPL